MINSVVQQPLDRSRDAVARRLAEAHFRVEPGIRRIFRLLSPPSSEVLPKEPIKLLEVNEETSMSGIVPVFFGPHSASGVFFPSAIVEVRPEEFERIRSGELSLPDGWTLGDELPRPVEQP